VGIAEKVFKIEGQRSKSRPDQRSQKCTYGGGIHFNKRLSLVVSRYLSSAVWRLVSEMTCDGVLKLFSLSKSSGLTVGGLNTTSVKTLLDLEVVEILGDGLLVTD